MAAPARVLYVDDHDEMRELVPELLERHGALSVTTATTVDGGLDRLAESDVECVVCDYDLPDSDGLEFLAAVRERRPDLPFVLFTGQGSEDIASEAISAGVTDYMQKGGGVDTYQVLANRVENAVKRHRAEAALRESERRYRTVVERSHDAIYIYRGNEFLFVNDRTCELTGYDEEELLEMEVLSLIHPDDRERVERYGRRRAEGRDAPSTYEARVVTASGETRHLSFSVQAVELEGGRAALGSARDVTERHEREAALERYETIVQASGDPVYTLDADGRFTFVNERLAEMAGYDATTLVGEHVSVIMEPGEIERGKRLIRELLESDERERGTYEMELTTADGSTVPTENHIALLPFDDGEFRGTVGVVRDITGRRARERELERQNERLEEFASVVSHDLRNPLNVAQARLDLYRTTDDDEHLGNVDGALTRMEDIVADVLTLARHGRTVDDPETVQAEETVTRAWANVETGDAELRAEFDRTVRADSSRLQQLLENLFANAVEHGGEDVTVTVGELDEAGEPPEIGGPPGTGGFFVADDGPGIPPADRERVFESSYSTAEGGTGFGLSIVESIAEAHGWTVTLTESEAGGARFELSGVEFVHGSAAE